SGADHERVASEDLERVGHMVVMARDVALGGRRRSLVVADAARVGDPGLHRDRPALLGKARAILLHRCGEVELALLGEPVSRRRGHGLSNRSGAVGGVGLGRYLILEVGIAEALRPHDLAAMAQGPRASWRTGRVERGGNQVLDGRELGLGEKGHAGRARARRNEQESKDEAAKQAYAHVREPRRLAPHRASFELPKKTPHGISPGKDRSAMKGITPFLWFNDDAEKAIQFYTSVFKNSKVGHISRYGDSGPGPKG